MHSLDDIASLPGHTQRPPIAACDGNHRLQGNSLGFGLEHGVERWGSGRLREEGGDSVGAGVSRSYALPYQRPYDPDPGEPALFGPDYAPYRAEMPAPTREPPPLPPPAPCVGPEQEGAQYDDLLMSNQWLEVFMRRLAPPSDEPRDPRALGLPRGPANLQIGAASELGTHLDRDLIWP